MRGIGIIIWNSLLLDSILMVVYNYDGFLAMRADAQELVAEKDTNAPTAFIRIDY